MEKGYIVVYSQWIHLVGKNILVLQMLVIWRLVIVYVDSELLTKRFFI